LALGRIEDRTATAKLVRLTSDPDASVRRAAWMALGLIGDEAAREKIESVLSKPNLDPDDAVAWAVSIGLLRDPGDDVIKLGMDTRQVVARFEAERQALALMDHPNIARVLDAGATEAGRPYFVMELVKGIAITKYCNQNHLSLNARLELFVQICHAIQHAHQKGIIHRDIKPSNVMVTMHDGVPVPKVIDFGIAKATEMRLTEKTLFTQYEQFMGTPAYMSPEQAEMTGLDIDTRSDIYSLGVLLYELLTGRPPFSNKELVERGIEEARRTIRETEPPRPSTRLSTLAHGDLSLIAKERSADGPKLRSLVRGDLEFVSFWGASRSGLRV
jgi:serine/threonine protein kinase